MKFENYIQNYISEILEPEIDRLKNETKTLNCCGENHYLELKSTECKLEAFEEFKNDLVLLLEELNINNNKGE